MPKGTIFSAGLGPIAGTSAIKYIKYKQWRHTSNRFGSFGLLGTNSSMGRVSYAKLGV
jgi:hypothetical protein